jgi:serine/threonine protein kinase/tetratricopeptide (TPR) repeat protein
MVKRIGDRFEIDDGTKSVLGAGGMGTVYRGVDTQTGEMVAIKELKLEVMHSTPDVLERFEREADALRMLNHPNIVKVLASFSETDHHYIVMEYVTGGSLRDILDETPQFSIEHVLEISLDLADALTRAHRLKIIHRDIKPANVLLAEDGTPRLTDFGVARIDEKTRMTETGMVVGTLSYLSPEALDGQKPDERQDIWGFGIMLYEMLTGTRPFDGSTASEVITRILTKDAPDIIKLRPEIPIGLIRLIQSMLEKDPDYRISSIRKVGTELENIIRGVNSDEYHLDSGLVQAIKDADHSRFVSDSDEIQPSPLSTPVPSTKYHIPTHAGVKVMQDKSGDEVLVLPAQMVMKGRKFFSTLFIGMLVVIIGLIIALRSSGEQETTEIADVVDTLTEVSDSAWIDEIPTVADDEYLVLILSHPDILSDTVKQTESQDDLLDIVETFQRDIPFSNIKAHIASASATTLIEATQLFSQTSADVMVWTELDGEQIDYWIQGGNPSMAEGLFEVETVAQLTLVEVTVAEDQTLAPYVLGALNIVHATNGNTFDFMRSFAILEEIDEAPAILESGGTSEHYFNFFNQFLDDTPAAIDAITQAIELDGGNPLWYAMRGFAYMRLNDDAQSERDSKTAMRIGPDGWSIPLIIQATASETFGKHVELLDNALEFNEDWFTYYLRAIFHYSMGNLDQAWDDTLKSIANNPQANYPYVVGFLIAIRDGRVQDAGDMMAQMVENEPDPTLGNRVYRATFGDNNIDVLLSGKLYQGFGYMALGQYEPVIAFATDFNQMLTESAETMSSLDTDNTTSSETYFSGDVLMMMGLSFCAVEDYETAFGWLSQAIDIDPTSLMLRYIRVDTAIYLGMTDIVQADLEIIRGLSDEFDDLITASENQDVHCNDFFDYFVDLGSG